MYDVEDVPNLTSMNKFPTSKLDDSHFVQKNLDRKSFDKCEFAMKASEHLTREALASRFDFGSKVNELIERIREWNK